VGYLILKWWHIIALISWMAGLLYLIRLLVYHAGEHGQNKNNHALLSLMERRLARYIMRPSMLLTWLTGLGMVSTNHQVASSSWFMIKLVCVIIMSFITERAAGYGRRLWQHDTAQKGVEQIPSSKALRWINEIPTVLLIIIVAMVVFRPF